MESFYEITVTGIVEVTLRGEFDKEKGIFGDSTNLMENGSFDGSNFRISIDEDGVQIELHSYHVPDSESGKVYHIKQDFMLSKQDALSLRDYLSFIIYHWED